MFSVYIQMISNHKYLALLALVLLSCSVITVNKCMAPFLTQESLNCSAKQFGILMSIIGISYFLGSLGTYFTIKKYNINALNIIAISIFALGVIIMLIFSLNRIYSIYTYLIPLILIMFASGILLPNFIAKIMSIYPNNKGQSGANIGFTTYLFGSILTTVIGIINIRTLLDFSYLLFVIFILIAIFYLLVRKMSSSERILSEIN
jgi:MFS family permease